MEWAFGADQYAEGGYDAGARRRHPAASIDPSFWSDVETDHDIRGILPVFEAVLAKLTMQAGGGSGKSGVFLGMDGAIVRALRLAG